MLPHYHCENDFSCGSGKDLAQLKLRPSLEKELFSHYDQVSRDSKIISITEDMGTGINSTNETVLEPSGKTTFCLD